MPVIHSSSHSASKADTSRKRAAVLGKMEATRVRRLSSRLMRSRPFVVRSLVRWAGGKSKTVNAIGRFSSAHKATEYLVVDHETSFSLRLVARSSLTGLIDDLRRMGMHGFCFDADHDGGMHFLFNEIETAVLA